MGYTHYWRVKTPKKQKGLAEKIEKQYQKAVKQCQKICFVYNKNFESGDYRRLSGYAAFSAPGKYGGLDINGSKEYSHENFVLREHFNQNRGLEFCKTARKPYDTVVVACLIVLKHHLGEYIEVSSDGYSSEWYDGLELAKQVTGLKSLRIPETIETKLKIVV